MDKIGTLSTVTRTIMLGVGLGALSGCASDQARQAPMQMAQSADEQEALQAALASRSPREATVFLRRFPQSRSIPSLLSALPPGSLHAIPRSAVANLPRQVLSRIDPVILAEFRIRPVGSPVADIAPRPREGGGGRY
jgi:hypothetical protein